MAFFESSGNDVGGYSKKFSDLNVAKSSNQEPWSFSNISTLIVELYLQGHNDFSALGLRSSSTEISSSTHYDKCDTCSWKEPDNNSYCFDNLSNKMYVTTYTMGDTSMMGDTRRVFVFHNRQNGQMSIYPAHLLYGRRLANDSVVLSTAHIGASNGLMNKWVTHTDGDGNIYKSITVDSNNKFISTTLSVKKGYTYTFNMHTVSEAGCDGIIISARSLNSSISVSDGGNARCSGVNVKKSYTYYASNDGSLYIYFKTDSSNLTNSYQTTDSNGSTINKGCTMGDIEIIVEPIKTTVTLNTNGSTNGTTSIEIPYGTDMSTISIPQIPTRKPYCTFAGYYTGSSRNLQGKKYIDSNGKGVNGLIWDIVSGSVTLYALYDYSRSIVSSWNRLHCVYCTSSAASISTLQASAQITLGEISSVIAGTISGDQLNVNSSNHLGDLTMTRDKKAVTIPGGIARGDYIFEIKYTFTPDDTSVFLKEETKECKIWIIPTYIVTETMELPSPVPDSLVQKEDIPAGSFTLNNNNVSEYFRYPDTIPSTSTLIYNNGKSASSTPQITWSISSSTTFASLGTTITGRAVYDIPNNPLISMSVENRRDNGSYYDNRNKVIEIISDTLQRDDVGYYSQFKTLGVDSLNYADIVDGIETTYNISIPIGDLKYIYSVDLLCKYLYVFHNIGNGLQSSATIVPPLIYAEYNNNRVYREANEVTDLYISVTKNPIYVDDTATLNTTADFTSGSEGVSVNGLETFSGYDTSIIQIDNT